MHSITWDGNLASSAQQQANLCYEIGKSDVFAYSTEATTSAALDQWFREKANFEKSSCTCHVGRNCQNFLKAVRSSTTKVGCGVKTCANLFQDSTRTSVIKSNTKFLVCKFESGYAFKICFDIFLRT